MKTVVNLSESQKSFTSKGLIHENEGDLHPELSQNYLTQSNEANLDVEEASIPPFQNIIGNLTASISLKDLLITELESKNRNLSAQISTHVEQLSSQRQKVEKKKKLYKEMISKLKSKDEEKDYIVAKYEGKISYLEEEIIELEKSYSTQSKKNKQLVQQIEQIKKEYDALSEDYDTCIGLLNEQMNMREGTIITEKDNTTKIKEILNIHNQEMQEKEDEIESLKNQLIKYQNIEKEEGPPNEEVKQQVDLEKRYKSLEKLYMQQIEINGTIRDRLASLENTRIKELTDELELYKNFHKDYTSVHSNRDLSGLSIIFSEEFLERLAQNERTMLINLLSEKNQLESEVARKTSEIETSNQKCMQSEAKIMALNKKINEFTGKSTQPQNSNEILEISDNLAPFDYDLTNSLEMHDSLVAEPLCEQEILQISPLSEFCAFLISNKLINPVIEGEESQLKDSLSSLYSIKSLLVEKKIMLIDSFDIVDQLKAFLEQQIKENERNPSKSRTIPPINTSLTPDYRNFTDPGSRTCRNSGQPYLVTEFSSIDEKLHSKRKQIIMHKEQIICLKTQLREAENKLRTYDKLDLELLRNLVKTLIEDLPRLDEKHEKVVDLCISILGFTPDECFVIKKRSKPNRLRLKIFS